MINKKINDLLSAWPTKWLKTDQLEALKARAAGWRARREHRRKVHEIFLFVQRFNVDHISLKKSPLGGWVCTIEDFTEVTEIMDDDFEGVLQLTASGDHAHETKKLDLHYRDGALQLSIPLSLQFG